MLDERAEDHVWTSGILARIEVLAGDLVVSGSSPRPAGELDGLAEIAESHFSVEERRIHRGPRRGVRSSGLPQENSAL